MRRNLVALVGFASTFFGQALRAADPTIPPDLVAVEERVNRTATADARRWVAEQVRLLKPGQQPDWVALEAAARSRAIRVGEAGAQDANAGLGGLFAVMIEYYRLMNKEAREDQKLQQKSKQLELAAKDRKLAEDNKKIDEQTKEANEKYDRAMTAANAEMAIGIASGAASAVSAQTLEKARAVARRLVTVVTPVPTRPLTRFKR
jgi:hypothetical protein